MPVPSAIASVILIQDALSIRRPGPGTVSQFAHRMKHTTHLSAADWILRCRGQRVHHLDLSAERACGYGHRGSYSTWRDYPIRCRAGPAFLRDTPASYRFLFA
jgi:hypothetical protein